MKSYLIVRSDRIGDVVLTLPMAKMLKEKISDARVSFMCDPYTAPLLKLCPYVDDVIEISRNKGRIDLTGNLERLKGRKFNNIFLASSDFRLAMLFRLAGFRKITGNAYRFYSFLYSDKIYDHRSRVERHELEYNLNLLQSEFPVSAERMDTSDLLRIPEEKRGNALRVLAEQGVDTDKRIIIIHPGSGGSSVDLPVSKMKELVSLISEENKYSLIISGTAKERTLCELVAGNSGAIIINGEPSLEEFTAIISCAALFIANSTGPLHIASALGINTIGFYPKIKVCSAKRWGPYSPKGYVFEPEIDCNNCTREQCENLDCMNTIDVKKVLNLVKSLLNVGIQE